MGGFDTVAKTAFFVQQSEIIGFDETPRCYRPELAFSRSCGMPGLANLFVLIVFRLIAIMIVVFRCGK